MNVKVKFSESEQSFRAKFGEVHTITDGGYVRGYEQGYKDGNEHGYDTGYNKGHTDGLAQRKYETWTFTLTDGTVVEKEVALL